MPNPAETLDRRFQDDNGDYGDPPNLDRRSDRDRRIHISSNPTMPETRVKKISLYTLVLATLTGILAGIELVALLANISETIDRASNIFLPIATIGGGLFFLAIVFINRTQE